MIKFTIPGKCRPQQRHRVAKNGRMYDPSSTDKKQTWLQIAKFRPKLPLAGDISITLTFFMERPKSHFRTGKYKHLLKDNIPEYHSFKPDIDNLCKYVFDTIQGKHGMICDDSQICVLFAEKKYGIPRTRVVIEEIL